MSPAVVGHESDRLVRVPHVPREQVRSQTADVRRQRVCDGVARRPSLAVHGVREESGASHGEQSGAFPDAAVGECSRQHLPTEECVLVFQCVEGAKAVVLHAAPPQVQVQVTN